MNPEHAIDIYFNYLENTMSFLRRRDDSIFVLKEKLEPKEIGHAAFEGLVPKISNELEWVVIDNNTFHVDWDNVEVVVVWRDNEKTIVATPAANWGKVPDITLKQNPNYIELGEAILKQIAYSTEKRKQ